MYSLSRSLVRQFWTIDWEAEVPETAPHQETYVLTTQRACSIYVFNPVSHFIPLKFASKKEEEEGLFCWQAVAV